MTQQVQQDDFVHLHLHTEFSTLDGINRVDAIPKHIQSMGQKAVAITDHGNIAGSYTFFKQCRKDNVKPIIGMEAYYTVNDKSVKEKDEDGKNYYHMILLAKNGVGLKNLMAISSKAYTEGMYYKPRADDALLAEHSEGIVATTACLGSRASQLILAGRRNEASRLIEHHASIFKDNFLVELQLHENDEQQLVNQVLLQIAKERNLPIMLANDCHYTHEDDKQLHEQTLCMSTNALMSDPPWNRESKGSGAGRTRFSFGDIDVHTASAEWMWKRAQAQGIPFEAIRNTRHIADMIKDEEYFNDRKNRYPEFPNDTGLPAWEVLKRVTKDELTKKMGGMPPKEYRDRVNYELGVIKKMGFYNYLLIVRDFCEGARSEGVWLGPGRGSAAGSLVAYALGITQIDPIPYGLVFERWLNYGRAAQPLLLDTKMIEQIKLIQPSANTCTHHHHH